MVLEVHVWGPAFGLASIDAECLATVAYLKQTTTPTSNLPQAANKYDYRLIQSSPSAVPTNRLPALHDPSNNTWISGYSSIISHLKSTALPSPTEKYHEHSARKQADSTAYIAFLSAHAAPLVALSLYVSSANWAATTRPAYSAILPFPLPWVEPPAIRAAMSERAAHLGLSSLDTDAEAEKIEAAETASAAAGWVQVPASIKQKTRQKTIKESMTPEQKSRIVLEGVTTDVLDVLAAVDWDEQTVELRCLAFAYLALMLVPPVPRSFLSEVIGRKEFWGLCEFVDVVRSSMGQPSLLYWETPSTRARLISEGKKTESPSSNTAVALTARFAHGLVHDIPLIGQEWRRWWAQRRVRQQQQSKAHIALATVGGVVFVAANVGLFYLYKGLLPFGAPVQSWRAPVTLGLSGFGAAGALFSFPEL
ncbi:Tom37 C-terminal domain-containing protein [Apodospora peruviana]|uniref:Tom37 C-terminal domain-containing protein n=1 Tax=Apodospora peruviana TaxID=516989 RepID=A0AAE0IPT4_9PEZI|nr:Tom37 C-terminal domain-containing protein [Apodospora peruviana]